MQPKPHPHLHTYFLDADTDSVYHIMGPLSVKLTMLANHDHGGKEYFRVVEADEDGNCYSTSTKKLLKEFIQECRSNGK